MTDLGTLYLVGTPIGNLADISFRAIETLKKVDIIACEDKRETKKLTNYYKIDKKLIDYHKFNEKKRAQELIKDLKEGKSIALVSDAGMPLISDPGSTIVELCNEEGIPVRVVPGASAALSALILSGLDTRRFTFFGFPGKSKKEERSFIENIINCKNTVIIYESPHHLLRLLKALSDKIPNRKISISREMTKLYEETLSGSVKEMFEYFEKEPPRGEFVLVIEGEPEVKRDEEPYMLLSAEGHVEALIENGMPEKEAIKHVAAARGLKKRTVYEMIKIKDDN